jgi:hypothetical protein
VSIGAPVRFRSGWRQRPAVLADLSVGGFRLLTRDHVAPGRSIKLTIPAEVSGDRPLAVRARVLRATPDADGSHTVTAKLDTLRPKQLDALKGVLKAHASGPARFDASQLPAAPDPTPTTAGDGRDGALRLATGGSRAGAPEAAAGSPDANDAERRSGPRRVIDRRVIALGEEATRVLIGRDISVGGMRVNPNPVLSVGDDVRLAIHLGNQELPLVVTARVHRDDGERGLILRFHALDPEGTVQLNAMLESLPILDPSGGDGNGMIVSEILANGR